MRLLLASEVHLPVPGGVAIAASPDSVRQEQWLWELGLFETGGATSSARPRDDVEVVFADGPTAEGGLHRQLRIRHDRSAVTVDIDTVEIGGFARFDRPPQEIWVFVGVKGIASESGRPIAPGDALILEGGDPSRIELFSTDRAGATLTRIRLGRRNGADLRWVP